MFFTLQEIGQWLGVRTKYCKIIITSFSENLFTEKLLFCTYR